MAAGGSLDADTARLSRLGFSVRLPRTVEVLEEDNKCVDAVAPYEQAFADWVDAWRQTLMPHQHSLLVQWLAGDPQLRRELLAGATPAGWARTDDAVVRTFAEPEANLALAMEIVALPLVERQRRLAERRLAGHRIAWLRAGSDDDARVHVAVARYQTTRPLMLDEFYRAVKRDSAGRVVEHPTLGTAISRDYETRLPKPVAVDGMRAIRGYYESHADDRKSVQHYACDGAGGWLIDCSVGRKRFAEWKPMLLGIAMSLRRASHSE